MRAPTDLHPDDHADRIALRDTLTGRRRELGYSQQHLAALAGMSQAAIGRFEISQPQRINQARTIAHALDLRLVMHPDGLPGGPYDDPGMLMFRPSNADAAAVWDQQQLMTSLAEARRACGHTQASMARLLGSTENAVGEFERTKHGLLFGSVQRYCRVLGGWLWLGVETLPERAGVLAGVA